MARREKTGGDQASPAVRRGDRGRFAPGSSGNPAGRPRGARDKRTEFLDELLGDDGEAMVARLVKEARAGKSWALRLAIEKLLPARRDRRVRVELPRVDTTESVSAAVAEVIRLAADGELTVDDAGAFLRLIDTQRKAIETNELAARLELIEARQRGEVAEDV